MFKLGGWNIRGLNDSLKQHEVARFISSNKLSMVGIVETQVQNKDVVRLGINRN